MNGKTSYIQGLEDDITMMAITPGQMQYNCYLNLSFLFYKN